MEIVNGFGTVVAGVENSTSNICCRVNIVNVGILMFMGYGYQTPTPCLHLRTELKLPAKAHVAALFGALMEKHGQMDSPVWDATFVEGLIGRRSLCCIRNGLVQGLVDSQLPVAAINAKILERFTNLKLLLYFCGSNYFLLEDIFFNPAQGLESAGIPTSDISANGFPHYFLGLKACELSIISSVCREDIDFLDFSQKPNVSTKQLQVLSRAIGLFKTHYIPLLPPIVTRQMHSMIHSMAYDYTLVELCSGMAQAGFSDEGILATEMRILFLRALVTSELIQVVRNRDELFWEWLQNPDKFDSQNCLWQQYAERTMEFSKDDC
ncbi:MAG: hypothetical protein LBI34_00565 [Puniceicoccales bacterium]|jgi:hypothetical protein|nr:hypothetical protein [Puniceicoccales bacterium]